MTNKMIQLWRFYDAPDELQQLSTNGGDEDWIIVIPSEIRDDVMKYGLPYWFSQCDSCCEPQEIVTDDGQYVIIGSHA